MTLLLVVVAVVGLLPGARVRRLWILGKDRAIATEVP